MLSDPLNVGIITSLADGPASVGDLRRAVGLPSQTTLRTRLRALAVDGVVERHANEGFPGVVTHELTPSGRELRVLAEFLARWLGAAPGGPLLIGSPEAKAALKALIGGWTTNMLRALAAKPLSLTELDRVLTRMNYPALERRLDALRVTGQVTPSPAKGRRRLDVTLWLREAVGPMVAAVSWERRASVKAPDLNRLDVETLFLLAIPTLDLSGVPDGTCSLEVQLAGGRSSDPVEISVTIVKGRAVSCRAGLGQEALTWASGTVGAWLTAPVGSDQPRIATGGDRRILDPLISGFREVIRPEAISRPSGGG